MGHIFGVVLPLLLQLLFVFIVIEMNTGNGSWVGLGALLLAMFAIPATGISNFMYIRAKAGDIGVAVLGRCFLIALVLPFIILILLMIG